MVHKNRLDYSRRYLHLWRSSLTCIQHLLFCGRIQNRAMIFIQLLLRNNASGFTVDGLAMDFIVAEIRAGFIL